jgi:FKBP-type peptidyl-prolyl cis-trans isomerase
MDMKKLFFFLPVLLGAVLAINAEGIAEEARKGNEKADMSYAFGMIVASDLAGTGLEFNYNAFIRGFREVMEKQKTRYTMDEAMNIIQTAFASAQAEVGERNLREGTAFLARNAGRTGVVTTTSGLQYELIAEGYGETPAPSDTVSVHYRGMTIDNFVFDSTYEEGVPLEIPLYRVIPGWSEGLRMMREGGSAKLYIPSNLAYGEEGMGSAIGPNSVLIFEVELLSIIKPEHAAE